MSRAIGEPEADAAGLQIASPGSQPMEVTKRFPRGGLGDARSVVLHRPFDIFCRRAPSSPEPRPANDFNALSIGCEAR